MRHAPFAIGGRERDAWLTHMRAAVDSLQLTPEQDATLWAYLEMAARACRTAWTNPPPPDPSLTASSACPSAPHWSTP